MLSRSFRLLSLLVLLFGTTALVFGSVAFAQDDTDEEGPTSDDVYVAINQMLIEQEARPLGRSALLDEVAQQIADELSNTGTFVTVPSVAADEVDYPRWPDNGQRVINQAINYIGLATPAEFADIWTEELPDILRTTYYREIGIGVSTYQAVRGGTIQNVYVIVLGAQPNVLPLVINDGADTVYSRDVELYIHNELSLAYETDPDVIQQGFTIRIANSEADLDTAPALDWLDNNYAVPWQLTDEFGPKEVWVEFEDEKGFTVRSVAEVEYADPASAPN